jgi:putative hydrolase of the HAD superfamily
MKDFVLFDLGNTLVSYYERSDFPGILQAAITEVEGFLGVKADWEQVQAEKFTAKDFSVRPLEERLRRIFPNAAWSKETAEEACRRFMTPIFALSRVYDDVLPTLDRLRAAGIQTAIVSNTPWGSPAVLWREELARLGLADAVDLTVFCGDCGWRKPAKQIFDHTLEKLGATPERCVFVGDDPRWDIAGPQSVGMEAVLIDRRTQTLRDVLKGIIN